MTANQAIQLFQAILNCEDGGRLVYDSNKDYGGLIQINDGLTRNAISLETLQSEILTVIKTLDAMGIELTKGTETISFNQTECLEVYQALIETVMEISLHAMDDGRYYLELVSGERAWITVENIQEQITMFQHELAKMKLQLCRK